VAVDAVRKAQGPFEVHALAHAGGPERGFREGFRRDVDLEAPAGQPDRREAGPAHGNAVADLGAGQVEIGLDGQPLARPEGRISAMAPRPSMIPVNMADRSKLAGY